MVFQKVTRSFESRTVSSRPGVLERRVGVRLPFRNATDRDVSVRLDAFEWHFQVCQGVVLNAYSTPLHTSTMSQQRYSVMLSPTSRRLRHNDRDKEILITLAESRMEVIESKRSDTRSIQLKKEAWDKLTIEYNSMPDKFCQNLKTRRVSLENRNLLVRCSRYHTPVQV